jgi:hypothetical protein
MPLAEPPAMKRVAVMQPYFLPYAGYFRLFAAVDEFVVYDCVQFPRRGRVHRTEVPGPSGTPAWLTLPLAPQPRETPIHALRFAEGARATLDARLDALPWLARAAGPAADAVRARLRQPLGDVVDLLQDTLGMAAALMGFAPAMRRSSALDIDPGLRGQARVIAIALAVGATHYLNAPGGRALYEADAFAEAGLQLEFLSPYAGAFVQLLPALVREDPGALRADVLAQLRIEAA